VAGWLGRPHLFFPPIYPHSGHPRTLADEFALDRRPSQSVGSLAPRRRCRCAAMARAREEHYMKCRVTLVGLAAAVIVSGGIAVAGTPFGGDDGGFIPPTKDVAKCENSVGKSAAKAAACVLGCHKKRAKLQLADDTAEDNCENNLPAAADCQGKYAAVTGNSSKINALCPACLSPGVRAGVFTLVESLIDNNNNKIYCAGTTPWGGDDTGFLPPDKASEKCEDGVGKAVAKTIACITKCHKSRASLKFANDTEEDACESGATESSCKGKWDKAMGHLDCSTVSCLDTAGERDALFAFVEEQVDTANGIVYCASPSGAFIDAGGAF
jgi:hypothetical protein